MRRVQAASEAISQPELDDVESRAPSAGTMSRLEWLCSLDWDFLWRYHFVRIITGAATLLGIALMVIFLAQRTLSACPPLRNSLFTAPAPVPLGPLMASWPAEPFWGIDAACRRSLGELLEQRLVDLKDMGVLCAIDYGAVVPVCAVRDGAAAIRIMYRPEIHSDPGSPHSALNEDMTFFPSAAPVPMIRFDQVTVAYTDPRTGERVLWGATDPHITHILQQAVAIYTDQRSIYDDEAAAKSIL